MAKPTVSGASKPKARPGDAAARTKNSADKKAVKKAGVKVAVKKATHPENTPNLASDEIHKTPVVESAAIKPSPPHNKSDSPSEASTAETTVEVVETDNTVDALKERIRAAAELIKKYAEKTTQSSLDVTSDVSRAGVHVSFALNRPVDQPDHNPTYLWLPHALNADPEAQVCLFVPSDKEKWEQKLEAERADLPMIKKIFEAKTFRNEFPTPRQRSHLVAAYDWFLADRQLRYHIHGKVGMEFKKRHMPVIMDYYLKLEVPMAPAVKTGLHLTPLFMRPGPMTSIRIGSMNQSVDELTENTLATIDQLVWHVKQRNEDSVKDGGRPFELCKIALECTRVGISFPLIKTDRLAVDEMVRTHKQAREAQKKEDADLQKDIEAQD